jgi:succinate-semialdehyde dehydrogenase
MDAKQQIQLFVERSREAQRKFESFSQQQVDQVIHEMAKVVFFNAEELARMAVDESRMGVYEDKVKKNQGKSRILWNSVKNKKTIGIINRDKDTGIVEIAKPVGVVAAITPCTNPIVTPLCNAMFALKGRNSVIISPHPRTKKCAKYLVGLFNSAISKFDVPENLIQILEQPSIELTNELMRSVDVIVATGGMGMVKAAYSSGKPAFGVGAGNVQCIIDRDINIKEAVSKIIIGRTFDNGIICSGEQTVITPEEMYDEVIEEFKTNGGYYVECEDEKQKLADTLYPDGVINKDLVGQSTGKIAAAAGIEMPEDTRIIVVKEDTDNKTSVYRREKMFPVITAFKYSDFDEAISIAQQNLEVEGKGHSVSIHSNNAENIEKLGLLATVSRVVVNAPCATTSGGSFTNGLAPTTTLGCGSWGNNSISENFTYKHLLNITRVAYLLEDAHTPTDDELWG